jgi:hypothetical protein
MPALPLQEFDEVTLWYESRLQLGSIRAQSSLIHASALLGLREIFRTLTERVRADRAGNSGGRGAADGEHGTGNEWPRSDHRAKHYSKGDDLASFAQRAEYIGLPGFATVAGRVFGPGHGVVLLAWVKRCVSLIDRATI